MIRVPSSWMVNADAGQHMGISHWWKIAAENVWVKENIPGMKHAWELVSGQMRVVLDGTKGVRKKSASELVNGVTGQKHEVVYQTYGDWRRVELNRFRRGRKCVDEDGRMHPNLLAIGYNELVSNQAGVLQALSRCGVPVKGSLGQSLPLSQKHHVKNDRPL